MSSPFHPGEREVQRRAGLAEEASSVGGIIARDLMTRIGLAGVEWANYGNTLVAQSVVALLRGLVSELRVGT